MAKAYSTDLRERVIARVDEGLKPADVAQQFDVSERTIWNWLSLRKQTGDVKPRRRESGRPCLLEEHRAKILQSVQEHPGLTLPQRKSQLNLPGSPVTLWKALRRWGMTFKKSHASD